MIALRSRRSTVPACPQPPSTSRLPDGRRSRSETARPANKSKSCVPPFCFRVMHLSAVPDLSHGPSSPGAKLNEQLHRLIRRCIVRRSLGMSVQEILERIEQFSISHVYPFALAMAARRIAILLCALPRWARRPVSVHRQSRTGANLKSALVSSVTPVQGRAYDAPREICNGKAQSVDVAAPRWLHPMPERPRSAVPWIVVDSLHRSHGSSPLAGLAFRLDSPS